MCLNRFLIMKSLVGIFIKRRRHRETGSFVDSSGVYIYEYDGRGDTITTRPDLIWPEGEEKVKNDMAYSIF